MPRKDQGWITFQISQEERQLLEEVCQMSQRTKTEVLREMLRGLREASMAQSAEPELPSSTEGNSSIRSHVPKATTQTQPDNQIKQQLQKPLKVSSRNILEGKVTQVIKGPVSSEITLEIVHRVELTATITTTSAEALELAAGKTAYAVIKSSDIIIAME